MKMKKHTGKKNIVLIGMPGSGKSTIGVILAKMLAMDFVDTDILIQNRENMTLQEIIDSSSHMVLRKIEEEVLLSVDLNNHIIATGGSAAYSAPAMNHLKKNGLVVFLHADLITLTQRIKNYENRGLAKRKDQTFDDLFNERYSLYTSFADFVIESSGNTQDDVCEAIINDLNNIGFGTFGR